MEKKKCGCKPKKTETPATDYSGVAIDRADENKVNEELEKGYTKILNDNPRSDE